MYSIGALSKKTGVTVRTLDYYDEIGLLHASAKTAGGHRLYSETDVMRLEQILGLKYMNFSLEQIQEILKSAPATFYESIDQQLKMVKQQQIRLEALEQALHAVQYALEIEKKMNWPIIFDVIRLFQDDPEVTIRLYGKYLEEEEIRRLIKLNNQMGAKQIQEWRALIQDVRGVLNQDPASPQAQELAKRWLLLVQSVFGEDEEILNKMWCAIKEHGNGICHYPMDAEVIDFIDQAMRIMEEKSGVSKISENRG